MNQLRLKENEVNLQKLFRINPLPLFLVNQGNGQILLINNAACEYFNITESDLYTRDIATLLNLNEDWSKMNEILKSSRRLKNFMVEQRNHLEVSRWILLNVERIDYKNEDCLLIGLTDITELKRIENELTKQASIDPLTGVHNRRFGMEFLQDTLNRVNNENIEFTLCFIDINNLKIVNDKFGHPVGDSLIQIVCNVIKSEITDLDVLFRLGGDEFIVIFFLKTPSDVEKTWNNIISSLNQLNRTNKNPYHISASHGLFHVKPGMDTSIDCILDMADKEMYKEKTLQKVN
ncbi:diguanylate cyclase [Bacillus sp. JJ1521]|uniref:sensor domain-containing diguanylate cyclase n=1 Tax=Bacillus sp. JJ1521 TaxID=3122957 RepID=UPI002FFF9FAC